MAPFHHEPCVDEQGTDMLSPILPLFSSLDRVPIRSTEDVLQIEALRGGDQAAISASVLPE
jgi:hypothetical protein